MNRAVSTETTQARQSDLLLPSPTLRQQRLWLLTPRRAGQRLLHPGNSHTLPGQPLWLQGAGRRSVLSSSAVPRPHGRGRWSSWRWAGERASSAGGDSVPQSVQPAGRASDSLLACSCPAIFQLRCHGLRSWSAPHASSLGSSAATSECALVEVSISSSSARSAPDAEMRSPASAQHPVGGGKN